MQQFYGLFAENSRIWQIELAQMLEQTRQIPWADRADPHPPEILAVDLGVIETGFFLGMAERAFVATEDGVRELRRESE